ncbi:MAG: CRISPR-associated endonuclease Cas2 [Spirochaetia bacterium]|nr:CRISPR-associated endonuclease Cas2 [Spirochaetia bacterium]
MRVIVMFDLPVTTSKHMRTYRLFRKWLIETGFVMMQESIYSKIVLNPSAARFLIAQLKAREVNDGLIQALIITEKQFSSIEFIIGQIKSDTINDMRRLVII